MSGAATACGEEVFRTWDGDQVNAYNDQYWPVMGADLQVEEFLAHQLGHLLDQGTVRPDLHGADVGTGGSIRGLTIIGPLVSDGGEIVCMDVGPAQVARTSAMQKAIRWYEADPLASDRGIYPEEEEPFSHERVMAAIDPRWRNATPRAAKMAKTQQRGIMDLTRSAFGVIHTGHCPESATSNPHVYEAYMRRFQAALKTGGILVMPYVVGSTGYSVGPEGNRILNPAVKVYPEDHPGGVPEDGINLHALARKVGFRVLASIAIPHGEDDSGIRPEGDATSYWGLGAVIMQKYDTTENN